jgi:hypothetical protein
VCAWLERALASTQPATAALALEPPRRVAAARRGSTAAARLVVGLVAATFEPEGGFLGRRGGEAITTTEAATRSAAEATTTAATEGPATRGPSAVAATAATSPVAGAITRRSARSLFGLVDVEPATAYLALVEQLDRLARFRL